MDSEFSGCKDNKKTERCKVVKAEGRGQRTRAWSMGHGA